VALLKNVSWNGSEPYSPGQLENSEKHSGDFCGLVQRLSGLGGVEIFEQWSIFSNMQLCFVYAD
jgi:hypothetical protein